MDYVRTDVTGTPAELVDQLLKAMEAPPGPPAGRIEIHRGALVRATRKAPSGLAPWQMRRVQEHVESALSGVIRVTGLAAIARLSPSHFTRAFKVSFGTAPGTYVSLRRVERAKAMMLESHGPLCLISLDCGFTDQAHLSRVFRRSTGQTPSRWRREHQNAAISLT